jgi:very-short-patch-repair endonuclease
VFSVGPLDAPHADLMAAVLAVGDGALASHESAGRLWSIRPRSADPTEVTVVGRDARGPQAVRVHRVRQLHPADATRHEGVPVTSPARTLLDLAAILPPKELARAIDEAMVNRLVTAHSLNEQFSRYPRHRGVTSLKQATTTQPAHTRSEAERRLLELIRAARLPEPRTNARVGPYEVDFLWPEASLVVEVDGYAFHSTRSAFERDRRRDADLQTAGCRVLRVTWKQIEDEPEALVASVAVAYGQRSRGPM